MVCEAILVHPFWKIWGRVIWTLSVGFYFEQSPWQYCALRFRFSVYHFFDSTLNVVLFSSLTSTSSYHSREWEKSSTALTLNRFQSILLTGSEKGFNFLTLSREECQGRNFPTAPTLNSFLASRLRGSINSFNRLTFLHWLLFVG